MKSTPGVNTASGRATKSQRALELRKYFAPSKENGQENLSTPSDEVLIGDGALSAYAETVISRLRGVHAMVSLIDRTEQYFIAGARRISPSDDNGDMINESSWFGHDSLPISDGPCEKTLELDQIGEKDSCFIINDLSLDDRYASLPIVNGSLAKYRFYAGTPITTDRGIVIGSFFIFDDRPRNGLTSAQRKYLCQQAVNVMKQLETKRQAAERRRVMLMSQGIADFLERTSLEPSSSESPALTRKNSHIEHTGKLLPETPEASPREVPDAKEPLASSTKDQIRTTLNQAASILRESLELTSGGVVFLDTTLDHADTGSIDAYLDEHTMIGAQFLQTKNEHSQEANITGGRTLRPPVHEIGEIVSQQENPRPTDRRRVSIIQAISAAEIAMSDLDSVMLDGKTLQFFLNSYPKGNVWYIDDEGFFSSLDEINEIERLKGRNPFRANVDVDITKQIAEAAILTQFFHKARQIVFLPLWDAAGDRWYSGCFVWTQSSVPVFTVESEIAYLSAFTNSVTVEISRLDAVIANKIKSDFISSISHEFRSPLHGILASAEYLRESELDVSQVEFVSTIQNCSGTLLDTINHVLDYSKINSFGNPGNDQDGISHELYRVTNLALLCEDLINGMIVAEGSREAESTDRTLIRSGDSTASLCVAPQGVEIILDIEQKDWIFRVQAGALRRIVMNIFGNAQKYTVSGHILVQVRLQAATPDEFDSPGGTQLERLLIRIKDTGKGMSQEYMNRKLYQPFAQEDSFATGVGLGLSIVKSIVNQLKGDINIRSELGKGTEVEVTIPIERPDTSDITQAKTDNWTTTSDYAERAMEMVRERAKDKSVLITRSLDHLGVRKPRDLLWDCIKRYCSEWFGYKILPRIENDKPYNTAADLLIIDHDTLSKLEATDISDNQRLLVVHGHVDSLKDARQYVHSIGKVSSPIGPFKLARCILAALDQDLATEALESNKKVDSTPNPTTPKPTPSPQPHIIQKNEINSSSPPSHASNGLNILIVDDNVLNVQLLHRYLQKRTSDTITTAFNGIEGLTSVREAAQKHRPFDIIFMDISMPKMDGFEATSQIRRFERSERSSEVNRDREPSNHNQALNRPDVSTSRSLATSSSREEEQQTREEDTTPHRQHAYVVALTGLASRRDRDRAKACGFDDFLTKPFSFGTIGTLLEERSLVKEGKSMT